MPITDLLDNQRTEAKGDKRGSGALPNALLTRLRDLGINCDWTLQAQETPAGTFVQMCFYPTPPAAPAKPG